MMQEIVIKVDFSIGDSVTYANKIGKDEGQITGYSIRQNNSISYAVTWSDKKESYHYSFELNKK